MTIASTDNRVGLVREALLFEWITIAWMVIEAVVAIGSGIAAHSMTLTAFGLDSVIELISAVALIWRLGVELKHGKEFSATAERRASKIGGGLLFALAAYVVLGAAWSIWNGRGEEFSMVGLALAVAAIPIMYFLAKRKIHLAERIGSRALRADAVESITCGWLSFVVVIGLLAQLGLGAWWVDPVTSLAIVWLLLQEGREAWQAEEGCE